jgi:hypothetical protein
VRRALCVRLLALGAAAAFAAPARADGPRDAPAAEALFQQGVEELKRGDVASACPKFAESQRLDPGAGTLMNLADCEEKLGRIASAWEHWREAVGMLDKKDTRIAVAMKRRDAIEHRVPLLTVALAPRAPPDTMIARDGVALGAVSLGVPLPIDPGDHVVAATAPGREDSRTTIHVEEGDRKLVAVAPGPVRSAATRSAPIGAAPVTASEPAASDGARTRRTVGLVVGGVGVAGFGVALTTGLLLPGVRDTIAKYCDPTTKVCTDSRGVDAASQGRTLAALNTVGWIVGYAGVAVGGGLIVSSLFGHTPATADVAPTSSGARARVTVRF